MMISVVDAFEAAARAAPGAPALAARDTVWTYRELASAVDAVARALSARRVRRGSRIALLLASSPQYVALYYGAMAAGRVAVPLNPLERRRALIQQVRHCGASLLCGDPAHPEWNAVSADATHYGVAVMPVPRGTGPDAVAAFIDSLGASQRVEPITQVAPEELAAIFFTSGTAGRPKGVMLSHRNLASNAQAIAAYLGLTAADRGLCVLPLHLSYGNSILNSHLVCGARLALEDSLAFPQSILQRMQTEAISGFAGVPATFSLLRARSRLESFDLRALRYITQAGGPMPRGLVAWLREKLPAARLYLMYGQTEATARLTYLPPERLHDKPGSVGIPIADVELAVLRDGRTAAHSEVGEVCARGPNVMLGYWQDAEATARTLQDGWLHTGDLGHRDTEGYLYLDGRQSEVINTGAYRVSPEEIEEVIAALPGVSEVGVTAIEDEILGHAIKAVVVASDGALEAKSVQAHCRAHLAAYKVPKVVEFATALPRSGSGKLQRSRLT
jgi:long-chain acyl-CoA synthetase